MQRGKDGAGNESGQVRRFERILKAIRKIGIERHLLKKTKGCIVQEMPCVHQMMRETVESTEQEAYTCRQSKHNQENPGSLTNCWP